MTNDLAMTKSRQENETKRVIYENEQKIKRQQEETEVYKTQCTLEAARIIQAQKLDLQKIQIDTDTAVKKQDNRLELEKLTNDFALKKFEDQLKVDNTLTPLTLQKYMLDSTR